jgi:hypothetical protein
METRMKARYSASAWRSATSVLTFASASTALATLFLTWGTYFYQFQVEHGLNAGGGPPPAPTYGILSNAYSVRGLAEILMGFGVGLCVAAFMLTISVARKHPGRIAAGLCILGVGLAVVSFPWLGPSTAGYFAGAELQPPVILNNWFPIASAGAFLALACALVIAGVVLLYVRGRRHRLEKSVIVLMVLAAALIVVAILRMLFSDDSHPDQYNYVSSSVGIGTDLAVVVAILCTVTAIWSAIFYRSGPAFIDTSTERRP